MNGSTTRLISVIVPAFNEEECVDELASRLSCVANQLHPRYEFEFIIIENGSADSTYDRLLNIRDRDNRFKIIRFSRNFGIEAAISAGLQRASGDAAVIMCADLQDPPELIPVFLERWEQGYKNVYGIVSRRTDEGWLRVHLTGVYYWLLNRTTGTAVPRDVSDFRLVDRHVYQTLNGMPERRRMLRTMWPWLGFASIGVAYTRAPRFGGKSTYKVFRNIVFGLRGIASATAWPLGLIPVVGVALGALSFALLAGFGIRAYTSGVPFNGFGTLIAVMLLMFGLLFLFLGIMAEYIGIVYEEVRGRPLFITTEEIGWGGAAPVQSGMAAGSFGDITTSRS